MTFVSKLIIPAMKGRGPVPLSLIYRGVRKQAQTKRHTLQREWRAQVRCVLQRNEGKAFIHHNPGVWEYGSSDHR